MNIELNKRIYQKTDNINIVHCFSLLREELLIDKLEKQVTDLETQIANTPQKIETGKYPDEILALIAEYNMMLPDNTELQKDLDKKKSLLSELNNLSEIKKL